MPFNARQIATGLAVMFFFGVSFIGWAYNLSPFTCCKRAVTASLIVYIAGVVAVKVINMILINAMVEKESYQKKEHPGDDGQ